MFGGVGVSWQGVSDTHIICIMVCLVHSITCRMMCCISYIDWGTVCLVPCFDTPGMVCIVPCMTVPWCVGDWMDTAYIVRQVAWLVTIGHIKTTAKHMRCARPAVAGIPC